MKLLHESFFLAKIFLKLHNSCIECRSGHTPWFNTIQYTNRQLLFWDYLDSVLPSLTNRYALVQSDPSSFWTLTAFSSLIHSSLSHSSKADHFIIITPCFYTFSLCTHTLHSQNLRTSLDRPHWFHCWKEALWCHILFVVCKCSLKKKTALSLRCQGQNWFVCFSQTLFYRPFPETHGVWISKAWDWLKDCAYYAFINTLGFSYRLVEK